MKHKNFTPFDTKFFSALDQHDREHCVVVMRGTFDIRPGKELVISQAQTPLVIADEYYGEINKSSVKQESDLAPFKPKCDVIINGNAYAPQGKPVRRFYVSVKITSSDKTVLVKYLTIIGERYWKKRFIVPGWKLTRPKPIITLPIKYEYAHGGECRIEANEKAAKRVRKKYRLTPEQRQQYPGGIETAPVAHAACETNTVGCGYAEKWYLRAKKLRKIPAPQIEAHNEPIKKFKKEYQPQGYGTITKLWRQRLKYTGSYNDQWLKERWPYLPKDFDFAFYNAAHPDMQCSYLKGGEKVFLKNLTPEGDLTFYLPHHVPFVLVDHESGEERHVPVNLDTLIIEPDQKKATLVWHAFIPMASGIKQTESRMIQKEEKDKYQDMIKELEAYHGSS